MHKLFILLLALLLGSQLVNARDFQKNRLIVLTDIENEPDDTQSMVRLLVYSNVIDIKGLIATTSTHMRTEVNPESLEQLVQTYGKVLPNLSTHEGGFPTVDELLALIKPGIPEYGMNGVGDGKDTEGSDWIIRVLQEDDERPLWVSVWGGANTLAQALYKMKKTMTAAELGPLVAKLRVYTISDQDDSGIWIRNNFPELFYIVSPGGYDHATWTAINTYVKGINNETISTKWLVDHIQQGHGPLGALYPDVAYGMEGDTPSFLALIPNGLNVPEHPHWGGWGGRYEKYLPEHASFNSGFTGRVPIEPETREIWTNVNDTYQPYICSPYGRSVKQDTISFHNYRVTLWRWRDDFQNDFAARMDWCTKSYQDANHPPVPALVHPEQITVKSGHGFSLDAKGSTDPDGDNISYLWFNYPEAGTLDEPIKINSAENAHRVYLTAPVVDKPETAHFILKITDKGNPPLSRYKRVLVNIQPE